MRTSETGIARIGRIGIAEWEPGDAIAAEGERMLLELGRDPVRFPAHLPPPDGLDAVFFTGPFGSLTPLGRHLESMRPTDRPRLVWFITEQLPNPRIPIAAVRLLGRLRTRMEHWAYRRGDDGAWSPGATRSMLTRFAHRFRYAGDADWLHRAGLLDLLVTGSPWRAGQLRRLGLDPLVVPSPSHYPGWGADLGLLRDVPVLWLGKPGSRRRRRLLDRLEADLKKRGIPLMRVDGIRQPYVFGAGRTELLNRTRILVNLLRAPWDNTAMRYSLAAQNGALLVSEPTLPHTGFEPGVHYVVAPIEQMAERIEVMLADDAAREAITALARQAVASKRAIYTLVCDELERRSRPALKGGRN